MDWCRPRGWIGYTEYPGTQAALTSNSYWEIDKIDLGQNPIKSKVCVKSSGDEFSSRDSFIWVGWQWGDDGTASIVDGGGGGEDLRWFNALMS